MRSYLTSPCRCSNDRSSAYSLSYHNIGGGGTNRFGYTCGPDDMELSNGVSLGHSAAMPSGKRRAQRAMRQMRRMGVAVQHARSVFH